MKTRNPSIPTSDAAKATVIFVSIELSKKAWLVGIHTPLADKVGLHKLEAGDSTALLALIRRITERIQHVNRIKGLLATQGIYDYAPLRRHRRDRFEALTTAMGAPIPYRLRNEIM